MGLMQSLGGIHSIREVFFYGFSKIFGENIGGKDAYNFQKKNKIKKGSWDIKGNP